MNDERGTTAVADLASVVNERWRRQNWGPGLTWGQILNGEAVLAAVAKHARLEGARILEMGPGYGRFLRSLVESRVKFRGYVGLDLSDYWVRSLAAEFAGRPDIAFVCGPAEQAGPLVAGRRFEVIVSTLTWKHLYPDFRGVARACRGVLAAGGRLIVDLPETDIAWRVGRERVIDKLDEAGSYTRSYNRHEVVECFAAAGLTVVAFDYIDHAPDKRRLLVVAEATPERRQRPDNRPRPAARAKPSLLNELRRRFGAQKPERFMPIYERFLTGRRHESLRLVEIGVQSGNSLRMWRAFLPMAALFGIDIDPRCRDCVRGMTRTQVHLCDQSNIEQLEAFVDASGARFGVVIDDGGHHMHEQINSFATLFPHVTSGGLYFIEDLGTSYFRERGGGGIGANATTLAMLKSLVDSVNLAETTEATARSLGVTQAVTDDERSRLRRDVAAVHFYPSLAVIEKAQAD